MNRIFLITVLTCFFNFNSYCQDDIPPMSILQMLTNDSIKYWDRIATASNGFVFPGWQIDKKKCTVLEYRYDKENQELRKENNHLDVIIGEIPFSIVGDTLILQSVGSKLLIAKITIDTLILNEIQGGFVGPKATFIQSKDQKQRPIPFFTNEMPLFNSGKKE